MTLKKPIVKDVLRYFCMAVAGCLALLAVYNCQGVLFGIIKRCFGGVWHLNDPWHFSGKWRLLNNVYSCFALAGGLAVAGFYRRLKGLLYFCMAVAGCFVMLSIYNCFDQLSDLSGRVTFMHQFNIILPRVQTVTLACLGSAAIYALGARVTSIKRKNKETQQPDPLDVVPCQIPDTAGQQEPLHE